MERFAFGADAAFAPFDDRLIGVTLAPLTSSLAQGAPFQAAVFRLAPGGRIARHRADVPQVLAVLEGAGEVSGEDGVAEPITAGEAVFWAEGEEHATASVDGLTALIVEGPGLDRFRRSP
ncbi:MAG: cupin domain-containing protein [Thermoleophilia bacterium]|nr:cupin domain-containing protein [Thermoleophilia bacterium]